MTRRIHGYSDQIDFTQSLSIAKGWTERILWLALAASVFGLIYIKFMNRYHTIWLGQLENQYIELTRDRESLLLEKEKLLSHHRVEYVADKRLNLHMPAKKEMDSVQLGPYKA